MTRQKICEPSTGGAIGRRCAAALLMAFWSLSSGANATQESNLTYAYCTFPIRSGGNLTLYYSEVSLWSGATGQARVDIEKWTQEQGLWEDDGGLFFMNLFDCELSSDRSEFDSLEKRAPVPNGYGGMTTWKAITPSGGPQGRADNKPPVKNRVESVPARTDPAMQAAVEGARMEERTATDAAERSQTEALNARIEARNDAVEAENKRAKDQYDQAMAANRAQHDTFARDKARHEADLQRVRLAEADYARKMEEHRRILAMTEGQRRAENNRMREQEAKRRDAERAAAEAKAVMPWLEAVTLCQLSPSDPQSKLGNWRCVGPLQSTHAKLDTPQAALPLAQACGLKSGDVRELGVTGAYRAFGCGFGTNPNPSASFHDDVPRKLGVSFVPGRAVFRCARNHEGSCRTR